MDAAVEDVLGHIDAAREEMAELTLELANTYAPVGHEQAVAEVVDGWYQREGITSRLVPMLEERANVIARVPDTGAGRSLIFNIPLDTEASGARAMQRSGIRLEGDLILTSVAGETGNAPVDEFQGGALRGQGVPDEVPRGSRRPRRLRHRVGDLGLRAALARLRRGVLQRHAAGPQHAARRGSPRPRAHDHGRARPLGEGIELLADAVTASHRAVRGTDPPQGAEPAVVSMRRDHNVFKNAGVPAIDFGPSRTSAAVRGTGCMELDDMVDATKMYALTTLGIAAGLDQRALS